MTNSITIRLLAIFIICVVAEAQKTNDSAALNRAKARTKPVKEFVSVKGKQLSDQRLLEKYFTLQETYFTQSKTLVSLDINSIITDCKSCEKSGSNINMCFASCATRKVSKFVNIARDIAETAVELFCKPLGFLFEDEIDEPETTPPWRRFQVFVKKFLEYKDQMSMPTLVEAWLSNVLFLDGSPLIFHYYAKYRTHNAMEPGLISGSTPPEFAAKCSSLYLSQAISSLVVAANDKSHVMDVVLRGLFTIRSAAFYTFGGYQNLFGVLLQGLKIFIGRRCDLIAYAGRLEGQGPTDCDDLGGYPFPFFPVPNYLGNLVTPDPKLCVRTMKITI